MAHVFADASKRLGKDNPSDDFPFIGVHNSIAVDETELALFWRAVCDFTSEQLKSTDSSISWNMGGGKQFASFKRIKVLASDGVRTESTHQCNFSQEFLDESGLKEEIDKFGSNLFNGACRTLNLDQVKASFPFFREHHKLTPLNLFESMLHRVIGYISVSSSAFDVDLHSLGRIVVPASEKERFVRFTCEPAMNQTFGRRKQTVRDVLAGMRSLPQLTPNKFDDAAADNIAEFVETPKKEASEDVIHVEHSPDSPLIQSRQMGIIPDSPLLHNSMAPSAVDVTNMFPPILNMFSRTRAACFKPGLGQSGPSQAIASNYSETAGLLQVGANMQDSQCTMRWRQDLIAGMKQPQKKAVPSSSSNHVWEWGQHLWNETHANDKMGQHPPKVCIEDDSPIDELIKETGMSRAQFCEGLIRYRYYRTQGIPTDQISPFNTEWLRGAHSLLHEYPSIDAQAMIDDINRQVLHDYILAIKKAITDYALTLPRDRQRLGVPFVPEPQAAWGKNTLTIPDIGTQGGPPDDWIMSIAENRERLKMQITNFSISGLALLDLWESKYSRIRLTNFPGRSADLLEIDRINAQQVEHQKQVVKLMEAWCGECRAIVQEELAVPSYHTCPDDEVETIYFNQICALLSCQTRSLVEKTTSELVDYFVSRFDGEPLTYNEVVALTDNDERQDAFLVNTLIPHGDEVDFEEKLAKCQGVLDRLFKEFITCLNELYRPDHSMGRGTGNRPPTLLPILEEEQHMEEAQQRVHDVIAKNLENVSHVVELYDPYKYLLTESSNVQEFISNPENDREAYMKYIAKLRKTEEEIRANCPVVIRMQMMSIECSRINEHLCSLAKEYVRELLASISSRNIERNAKLIKQYEQIEARIKKHPTKEHDLVELEQYLDHCKMNDVPNMGQEFLEIKDWMELAWDMGHELREEDYDWVYKTNIWVRCIDKMLADREENLKLERNGIELKFSERRNAFIGDLATYLNQVRKFQDCGNIRQTEEYIERIAGLTEKLENAGKMIEDIHEKELKLGWEETEFENYEKCTEELAPYEKLWTLAFEHLKAQSEWMKGPLFKLDAEKVESQAIQMSSLAFKLAVTFGGEGLVAPEAVAAQIRTELDGFKKNLPLVSALCNEGLKDRHWDEIKDLENNGQALGFDLNPRGSGKDITLKRVLDYGILDFVEQIGEIADNASKEWQIEKSLGEQKEEWAPIICEFKEWKDTGTYILGGGTVDEIQSLLDDHVIKTQTMKGSPYAKIFSQQIGTWEAFLINCQDCLDWWLKVQAVWLYLEPIFFSEDIMRQLPTEGAMFKRVDTTWREIMKDGVADPAALVVFATKEDGEGSLVEAMKVMHKDLELVQKGLNDYLETKRLYFPRFFFLSNDNLLEILSETKDPTRVQSHFKKAFEGINACVFRDDKKIEAMISSEKEQVPLKKYVDPVAARGAVEKWLVELEDAMIESIRHQTFLSAADYKNKTYCDWLQIWPGQCVIGVGNIYWTAEVMEAMEVNGNEGLGSYGEQMVDRLNSIVDLVRTGPSAQVRNTLEANIVIFVHNKDTVIQLYNMGISMEKEFDWQVQLRYFIEDNAEKPGQEDVFVRITNSHLSYNYEYLGNSSRLVITPLTDRCYRTCCGALHLLYGAAPEGPAGTGKTETVKDLAKALARMCIVFNCSDGLDYIAMGKFFKGLAATGGWACFDEFNRIEAEVLSVVAQQILSIQTAIKARLHEFDFEGTHLPLKWSANAFITMNPGYAGRAELPDNLKALFRTVAMMVPDYAMIAEIKLYSFGFTNSRPLSVKIVTTYKLCSEQLSSQKHYDYGMRAVFSVLVAAGNLKRDDPGVQKVDEEGNLCVDSKGKAIMEPTQEDMLMLRAINDVNLAKFLAMDVPLFNGIKSDLFPGVTLPPPDYGHLDNMLKTILEEQNQTPHPYFMEKVIQFYDCHIVRHSVMLVGMPFSGKTCALESLREALTRLAKQPELGWHPGEIVHTARLNPKAIPAGCLYGDFDEVSHEWSDGIVAVLFRDFARNQTDERKWLIFDGPVDAVWIENMNTVMDDNKKLCLNSGEIIGMSPNMRILLEPMDVEVASPATISRNGMVFFEPHLMGFDHLVGYFINQGNFPEHMGADEVGIIEELARWILPPLVKFVAGDQGNLVSPCQGQNMVSSCLTMVLNMMKHFEEKETYDNYEKKNFKIVLDGCVMFSAIWSFGAVCNTAKRLEFDAFFKKLAKGMADVEKQFNRMILPVIPERGTVFDHCFDIDKHAWVNWMDTRKESQSFRPGTKPETMLIETLDHVRYSWLLRHTIKHERTILFCGPTGTGKTAYMQNVILSLDKEEYMNLMLGFSAQSKCHQAQDLIDSRLDRRRKGIYGPPSGKKMVVMVDDLNMPTKETYGAQPPIEILRMMIDKAAYAPYGGWYDRKDVTHPFRMITDVLLLAAMGPPGGGRTFITPRFLGLMHLVGFTLLDDDNMCRIFETILDFNFNSKSYPTEICQMSRKLVMGTLDIYKWAAEELLPTPAKVHYTFNLRDFSKVVIGILMMDKKESEDKPRHVRLWTHEVFRVFGDRLIDDKDRTMMLDNIREITKKQFSLDFDKVFEHLKTPENKQVNTTEQMRSLFFTDLMGMPQAPNRAYKECQDPVELQRTVEEHLVQYNMMMTARMDLVLFLYALEHLSRVARTIRFPGGNSLCVGVGGSGRQSCSRLAAFLADYKVYQIEIAKGYNTESWKEDLRALLMKTGADNSDTVFLFTDTQIKDESFVEDINNLLNTGEVPNLFPQDQKVTIAEEVRAAARQAGEEGDGSIGKLFAFFIQRSKARMSIVLCFSPIGDAWRTRLRQFPSLVNCCGIDWYTPWPADALNAVATRFLQEVTFESNADQMRLNCVEMCTLFHSSATSLGHRFRDEAKRFYYATPTSFLELISTFKVLLAGCRDELKTLKSKYDNGLDTLEQTEKSVDKMRGELEALQPQLIKKGTEVEAMTETVNGEKAKTSVIAEAVAKDEAAAQESADIANAIKADCEADLAVAMPALNDALKALDTLTSKDISEVKAMKNPPGPVKTVLRAVAILKGLKPVREKNKDTNKMEENYWPTCVKMIGESNFLQSLQDYDKDNIEPARLKPIKAMWDDEDFQPARAAQASKAAAGLCSWARAMEIYDRVAKEVAPKKAKLAEAEAEYATVMVGLKKKQAELKEVMDQLQGLQDQLDALEAEKNQLAFDVDLCEKKLMRADQLITSLGGEKTRWGERSVELAGQLVNLTGDILVSSGIISYLGAFTPEYRNDQTADWVAGSKEREIPGSDKCSVEACLGDPVEIRAWTIAGLPNDAFSIENGIIVKKARRWPLFIDPQGQANKWIKTYEANNKITTTKFSDPNCLRKLESCIQYGYPVLIENIAEETDPAIEPILLKQTFKKGNTVMMKLGESIFEYSAKFRLFLTTKLRNPHYLPEVAVKVTLLNFMITPVGLQDQLLNIVVAIEKPDLAEEKAKLIVQGAANKKQLADVEDQILRTLDACENILEDESAIKVLSDAKEIGNRIAAEQEIADETEIKIDTARQGYVPVAFQGSVCFFCVADLCTIDPMYQYSLPFFIDLYSTCITRTPAADTLDERIIKLNDFFMLSLFRNICRSLFERNKLLFSFLLCVRLLIAKGQVHPDDYRFLLTGGVSLEKPPQKRSHWIPDRTWNEFFKLNLNTTAGGGAGYVLHTHTHHTFLHWNKNISKVIFMHIFFLILCFCCVFRFC